MDGVDSFLYEMSRAESTGDLNDVKLGIVGISNDYTFRNTLSAKTSGSFAEHELNFGPYDAEDLGHILEERAEDAFRDGVLDEDVIPKCAALAARDKGDARQALDLLKVSGIVANENNQDQVTVEHVDEAKRRVERGKVAERIEDLTDHQRNIVVAVANAEVQELSPVRTKEIYSLYSDICDRRGEEPLSTIRSVREHLKKLEMRGFLNQIEHNNGRGGGKYHTYELSMKPQLVFEVIRADDKR